MTGANEREYIDTAIIGGGQAGLATGYFLKQQGRGFVIFDASQRIGDAWRRRWDSLRLFTPARYNGLPGMPFPAAPDYFPHKDEMAKYLQTYADRFSLPVESGAKVNYLSRERNRFVLSTGERRLEADNVVVAMSSYQVPWKPAFAADLDPSILQIHSADYRNPSQLQEGPVLIVGAGNSGSEIAMEVARTRQTWISGRDVGHVPFRIERRIAHSLLIPLVLRFFFHRLMTTDTPMGRKMRPKMLHQGGQLVRVKPVDMESSGIERLPRTAGVQGGRPVMEDGRVFDVTNVIWCTGYRPNFSWIDLPIFSGEKEKAKEPEHERGIVTNMPGLYFVGLFFLYALSSSIITGVSRDAKYIADTIAARSEVGRRASELSSSQQGQTHMA